jgi:mannose-6-phosphate isomerase
MKMYPMQCRPIFKSRIWGGQKLRDVFGKALPPSQKIGESWELSGLPEDTTIIENGEFAGRNLNAVLSQYSKAITGREAMSGVFPLLIKFIDAQDVLSVQVHPDAAACKRMGQGAPKTECWYIIQADPGAVIYKGLKSGTTRQQFEQAIKDGISDRLLNKVEVHAGECHFIPSGVCHAIGAGLLIAEIQQPSDTTYRVFDWNRVDAQTGKPRQLHVEQALESINFDLPLDVLTVSSVGMLIDVPEFSVKKGHQAANCEVLLKAGVMKVVILLNGAGVFMGQGIDNVAFGSGDTVLLPAEFEGVLRFQQESEYLVAIA